MSRILVLVAFLGALSAQAQSRDPLHSAECGAARERLEQALDEAAAKRPGAAARLASARRDAIATCFGGVESRAERSGAPEPVVRVPGTLMLPRTDPLPMPAPPVVPPMNIPRPAAITSCDPGGCWDSEGRRLNSQGPVLVGPRGACVVQGSVVQCP